MTKRFLTKYLFSSFSCPWIRIRIHKVIRHRLFNHEYLSSLHYLAYSIGEYFLLNSGASGVVVQTTIRDETQEFCLPRGKSDGTVMLISMAFGFGSESGSALDGLLDPDPHCEYGSGSRREKISQKKKKN
jgi:hypothetical protein